MSYNLFFFVLCGAAEFVLLFGARLAVVLCRLISKQLFKYPWAVQSHFTTNNTSNSTENGTVFNTI